MKEALLPYTLAKPLKFQKLGSRRKTQFGILVTFTFLIWLWNYTKSFSNILLSKKARFQKCSIDNYLSTGLKFLETAERPPLEEYVLRRNNLAKALVVDGVDAFVVEPGYTFSYYANITQRDWEAWEEQERPFLMVIRPSKLLDGTFIANTSFLVPHFEEMRARLLNMPFEEEISTITYEEHWDPYTTLWESPIWEEKLSPILMVDEEMRDFIARGLGSNGFTVVGLSGEIEAVRQIKTERELGTLRALNTGTVEAIRAMRKCLYQRVTENEVVEVLDNTLRTAGLEPFFNIVEFGKQAALPHGGNDGTATLEPGDFVLIDVGAHLYGYSSDVCRTFYPPFVSEPLPPELNITEKLSVWHLVLDAQAASVKAMVPNSTAAAVDLAARAVIEAGGYGKWFTHRLGHGIGIKAHESPYLNRGNFGAILRPGMVFTSEPGVYILNEFGVRHEDILVVKEDGEAENISGGFARSPWEP
ncbi:Creatinase/aminopeptidase, partial [Lojkania enalia]